jgi:uncharacterized protein (DUF1697 family)
MQAIIAMLRGVNVGPHNRISMQALRTLCSSLLLQNAQTYVQSGNVVFTSHERNLIALAKRIEDAFEQTFGFRILVILRTASEMQSVIAKNPFAKRKEIEPGKLLVTFLSEELSSEARKQLEEAKVGPEEIRAQARELYVYFPNGMGRSKLPAVMDRVLKKTGTARNWNSVTRMLEMAEGIQPQGTDKEAAKNL